MKRGDTFITDAGNIIEVADITAHRTVEFLRLAYIDTDGEQVDHPAKWWANLSTSEVAGWIERGVFVPAIELRGGNFIPESEWVDQEILRAEIAAEG